jgi:hypothetical protein
LTFENGESAEAVLTGFTITGGFGTADTSIPEEAGYLFWGAGIYCLNASPTITRNVIVNNNGPLMIEADQPLALGYGGAIATVTSNPTITHNVIKNNSAYAGAGIIVYLGDAQIRNNLIYDNSACVGGGVVLLYGGHLINNTIVGNDSSKTIDGQTGFAGNVYAASEPEFGPCLVVNNIICNAKSGGGIYSVDTGQGLFAFNDVWNNSPGNYALQNPETGELTWDGPADKTGKDGNICEDPLFVNPQGKDYHLQLDSPCISAGDPAFIASPGETDIDGEARVFAWRVDMGADESIGYVKPGADAGPDQLFC